MTSINTPRICNCWLGTTSTSGDSGARERCPVHGLTATPNEVCGCISLTSSYAPCTREKGHSGPCYHPSTASITPTSLIIPPCPNCRKDTLEKRDPNNTGHPWLWCSSCGVTLPFHPPLPRCCLAFRHPPHDLCDGNPDAGDFADKFKIQIAEFKTKTVEPFVVKHYSSDEHPSIKGNGFDGLYIGDDREQAQEFIDFINTLCTEHDTLIFSERYRPQFIKMANMSNQDAHWGDIAVVLSERMSQQKKKHDTLIKQLEKAKMALTEIAEYAALGSTGGPWAAGFAEKTLAAMDSLPSSTPPTP